MTPSLNYVIQVIIVSGLLYGYYHWVLRNKKFHHYNRYYLLGAALLSILIPLINIPVYFTKEQTSASFVYSTLTVFSGASEEEGVTLYATVQEKVNWFTWDHILPLIYITVAAIVFLRIVFSLLKIRRIIRRHPVEKIDQIRFLNTDEPGTPYSFFSWLFWNRKIELNSAKGEQIFRHELFHIEQKHSLDILFFELLTVAGWFNPFFHLMKKETRAIHEFLADQFAVTENNRWDYAELLLMQVLNTDQRLVHPFFHNQIKRRIAMITSPQKTSHQYLRKLMVLPVTALAVMLFAFSYKNSHTPVDAATNTNKKLILIDIGHGGSDPGAMGPDGTKEKDLVLSLAKHLKELNKESGFNIEFTRESDELPALTSRTKAGEEQPALFLSLHINSSPDNSKTGIEVYVPNAGHPFIRESQQLGSVLLNQLQSFYRVESKLLQRSKSVWVLENSNCPAALLEVGYISNNDDLRFLTKAENQKLVAEKILSAISAFLNQDIDKNNSSNNTSDTTIKPTRKITTVDKMVIVSDSIIFKSTPSKGPKDNLPESIVFLNGKQISKNEYAKKTIICDSFEYYGPDDKKAIKLYGPEAKAGVMIIHNGKFTTDTEIVIKEADKPEADKIFSKVEIEAAYPGGMDAWRKYLERNLNAEVPILRKAPAGVYTVVIQFIVNLDGSVSDTRALTNHGYGMEEEAIRAIVKGGKWLPAIQNGRQVNSYKKQPITFVVDNGPKKEGKVLSGEGKMLNEVVMVGYSDTKNTAEDSKSTLFQKVETEAEFPGGIEKWREYLQKNCRSTVATDSGAPIGKYAVMVQFVVSKEGEVSNIIPLTRHGYGMEQEVVRIIKEGPKWKPAEQNGRTITAYKKQIVTFMVSDDDNEPKESKAGSVREITSNQLNSMNLAELLGVTTNTDVKSFDISVEKTNGITIRLKNKGSKLNTGYKDIIQEYSPGKMIYLENILINDNGQEKKLPARVYKVVI